MRRILITGKNCELSRDAMSRAARLAYGASRQTGRAGFYSGTTPDAAAGGTRAPATQEITAPRTHSHRVQYKGPGVPQLDIGAIQPEDWVMIAVSAVICLANIAIIVLAAR